ncbi:hypothetical protein ACHAW6_000008, partial [Cyclotella cf. meneghiniana]
MLDACTNWVKLALIPTANAASCANQFDINWLCHYPRPTEVGHDNGSEFIAKEFQELLASYNIQSKPTTVKNPTTQALVERLHLTLGDHLRTTIYNIDNWLDNVNHLIQACAWAIRTTNPSSSPYNPSQLAFGMDMFFCQQMKIDWQMLKMQRRRQAIANKLKENQTRIPHTYKIGDKVLIVQKKYERQKRQNSLHPLKDLSRSSISTLMA